jgi:predicted acylesterase/phospholipase RssA/CRP-like cAMP-binding protein
MGLFDFGRKSNLGPDFVIQDIPLFSSLSTVEQKNIEKKVRLVEYKRDDIVYEEGQASDAFYVVLSGRFKLFNVDNDGVDKTLLFFYSGDHFGEASLLNGRPHSASVVATRDGIILRIAKDDFLKLVEEIPMLSLSLTRSMGHRLTLSNGGSNSGVRREVKITSLCLMSSSYDLPDLWIDLGTHLKEESKNNVILLDFSDVSLESVINAFHAENIKQLEIEKLESISFEEIKKQLEEHPNGFKYLRFANASNSSDSEIKISQIITALTYRYEHIVVILPRDKRHVGYSALKQTDAFYLFSESNIRFLSECNDLIEELKTYGFHHSDIHVVTHAEEEDKKQTTFEAKERIVGQVIENVLPHKEIEPDKYHNILRYLCRSISGNLVGLVLGSGAAYGLAHIGILKVLEEENIPIDIVVGCSMGALIGGVWAAGFNAKELIKLSQEINTKSSAFFKIFGLSDISVAHYGFFKGNKLKSFLSSYIGGKTFQDLSKQLRVVGTDLFTADEVVFRSGSVIDAIRVSVSIPGIFRPVEWNKQQLIDGGVIDPLPTRVLTKMGVKKIIAVNVLPSPKDWHQKQQLQIAKQRELLEDSKGKFFLKKAWVHWLYRLRQKYANNVFNVLMNSIQFMEFEMSHAAGKQADVLMHPIVHEAHWAQFYNAEKFIAAGENEAKKHLSEIKALINEQ